MEILTLLPVSPKDPYIGRSQTMYDPSEGPALRDHRRRGYTSHNMTEEHKRTILCYLEKPLECVRVVVCFVTI